MERYLRKLINSFVRRKNIISEITLRRRADKIGYHVTKGFQHCGRGVFHDQNGDRFTGYMILDQSTNFVIEGTNEAFDYSLTLSDVKDILKDRYRQLGLSW